MWTFFHHFGKEFASRLIDFNSLDFLGFLRSFIGFFNCLLINPFFLIAFLMKESYWVWMEICLFFIPSISDVSLDNKELIYFKSWWTRLFSGWSGWNSMTFNCLFYLNWFRHTLDTPQQEYSLFRQLIAPSFFRY